MGEDRSEQKFGWSWKDDTSASFTHKKSCSASYLKITHHVHTHLCFNTFLEKKIMSMRRVHIQVSQPLIVERESGPTSLFFVRLYQRTECTVNML